jgi:hypothetical protein
MKRFNTTAFGILQGSRVLFADFANGGVMWTGKGPRESRVPVTFDEPFIAPPAVMVGISMWDIDHRQNSRADISAESITTEGFEIVFRTWEDTRVARIRADWTAIGPLRDDDQWDVH